MHILAEIRPGENRKGLVFDLSNKKLARNHHFSFKQFTVWQERSAMKVCTDACIFGAWVDLSGSASVLDIGTGTGLLSLMAAQRYPELQVEGVELDRDAFEQTVHNFNQSPFRDRLKVFDNAIQDFSPRKHYDCIISNPPFFQNDLRSPDAGTNSAHHAGSLNFRDLSKAVSRLLRPGGIFHVLLPVAESHVYERYHDETAWQLTNELILSHRPGMAPFRRMLSLRLAGGAASPGEGTKRTELYIYDETGQAYDPAFREYLKPFYLGF